MILKKDNVEKEAVNASVIARLKAEGFIEVPKKRKTKPKEEQETTDGQ